jgi:hypothetical protein
MSNKVIKAECSAELKKKLDAFLKARKEKQAVVVRRAIINYLAANSVQK